MASLAPLLLLACTERIEVPSPPPARDPSAAWASLLRRTSSPRGVDYAAIDEERAVLEAFLAWNAVHGEVSDLMGEKKENRRLANAINVYNAAVIYGVLRRGPFDSVEDYRADGPLPAGWGFFRGLRFRVDGDWVSLHHLHQQRILGRFQDALVHFALTDASRSSPPLRWWTEQGLEAQLEQAARRYLESEQGLARQGEGWAVSALFLRYERDFLDWGPAADLCAFLAPLAPPEPAAWLAARKGACHLEPLPWDGRLNQLEGAPDPWPEDDAPAPRKARDTGERP